MGRSRSVGALAGTILALAVAGTAAAYWTQTPHTVTIFGDQGNIKCGQWVTFRAVIRDHEGEKIPDSGPVVWSFDASQPGDQIDPTQSNTDSHGRATTQVFFACVPGDRVLRATALSASGTVELQVHVKDQFDDQALTVAAAGTTGGSEAGSKKAAAAVVAARVSTVLPNTSTSPAVTLPMLVAVGVLLIGASLVVGQTATRRR